MWGVFQPEAPVLPRGILGDRESLVILRLIPYESRILGVLQKDPCGSST